MTEYNDIAYSVLENSSAMVLLKKYEASSSATISFTDSLDSTYKQYIFTYNNISSSVDGGMITINGSSDGGSNYNVTKTTTFTAAQHNEADDDTDLGYNTSKDVTQGTGEAIISYGTGNAADEVVCGYLHLYNPADTTFVKHFISNANTKHQSDYSIHSIVSGYFNTTSAINAIQFKMDQGNMDTGTIKLYGVK
jgi:hypothetical protein